MHARLDTQSRICRRCSGSPFLHLAIALLRVDCCCLFCFQHRFVEGELAEIVVAGVAPCCLRCLHCLRCLVAVIRRCYCCLCFACMRDCWSCVCEVCLSKISLKFACGSNGLSGCCIMSSKQRFYRSMCVGDMHDIPKCTMTTHCTIPSPFFEPTLFFPPTLF